MKPALARGEIQVLGATTPDEYRNSIEKDAALDRRFQSVLVTEPNQEEALRILRGVKQRFESFHGVRIVDAALASAVHFAERYITDRALPDKALDLIDEAAARLKVEIDSVPTELDATEREITLLQIEREALGEESDPEVKKEKERLETEIDKLTKEATTLRSQWSQELNLIQTIGALAEALATAESDLERAKDEKEVEKASEFQEQVHRLTTELKAQEKQLQSIHEKGQLVNKEVTSEDIAAVVGEITGIL